MVFKSTIKWEDEIEWIAQAGREGKTYEQIGEHYGVTRERIRQIVRRYIPNYDETHGRNAKRAGKIAEREEFVRKKWGKHRDLIDADLYQAQRAKFRAKKANALRVGWTWELSFGDIEWPTHCPILGIELDYFAEGRQENSPSFDQIDSGKGYVQGNVQILSWRANRIKNDGTAEEHRKIADYLETL